MSPTELAKKAKVRPQVIYNLIRQGYLKAESVEVKVVRMDVPQAEVERYLTKRQERLERKESK